MATLTEQSRGGDDARLMKAPAASQNVTSATVHYRRPLLDRYMDSWYPELSALVLSSACTIAIAAILGAFNGRANPSFAYGLTLNAVISILATTSKVSLIFAVSNGLSQLKWVWFNGDNTQKLLDAELFDDASRGPLGAFKILGSSPARSPVTSFGAVLIIIALVFDPFVQQIISYDTKLQYTQSVQAAMTQAQFPSMEKTMTSGNSTALKTAVNAGFFTTRFEWEPSCSTGNCTWPDFQTLAWCGRCEKDESWKTSGQCSVEFLADELSPAYFGSTIVDGIDTYEQYLSRNCTYKSDKRYHSNEINNTLNYIFSYSVNTTSANGSERVSDSLQIDWFKTRAVALNDIGWAINQTELKANDISYLSIEDEPIVELGIFEFDLQQDLTIRMSASTCYLDLCHQVHDLSVENGVVRPHMLEQERVRKSAQGINLAAFNNPDELPPIYQYMLCFEPPNQPLFNMTEHIPFQNNETLLLADPEASPFTFCDRVGSFDSLNSAVLESSWTGNETATTSLLDIEDLAIQQEGLTIEKYYAGLERIASDNWTSTSGPHMDRLLDVGARPVIENVAASLTKILLDPQFNVDGSRDVTGELGTVVTLVKVRWQWLILPAALCLGGIVFVLLTILSTRKSRAPLWKSSLNALLYHGIELGDADRYARLSTIPEMDRQAAATRAQLAGITDDRKMLKTSLATQHS